MKIFKKISAFFLAIMLLFTMNICIFAEETTSDLYVVKLSPENYAGIFFDVSGYASHPNTRAIEAYYNTRYPTDDYLLAEYFSMIASYNIPIKNALESIDMSWYIRASGLQSGRVIPIFYDLNKFDPGVAAGVYKGTGEIEPGYTAIKNYALNYWPASGYSYKSTPFASKLVMEFLESGNKTYTYDITESVMSKYIADDCTSEYLTLMTGRETNKYPNSSFSMKSDAYMPYITVKYKMADIFSYINSATADTMAKVLSDIGAIGGLSESTVDFSEYKALGADFRKIVGEAVFANKPEGGYVSFSEIAAAFSEAMNLDNIILTFINGANEENVASVMKNIGEAGAFSESTTGYQAYASLSDAAKKEANINMLSLIPEGGFTAVSDVATAFDTAMVLKTVTFSISPENYATLYIVQDAYYDTTNPLNLHYNRVYADDNYVNTQHMSIISSFEIPFRNYLTNIKANYTFTPGNNTTTGRVLPFFYDLNRFEIDAEAGVYDNTTDEYAAALAYANNYWPGADTDGWSYAKSKFKLAYGFNDTTASGMLRRTLDITDNVLSSLKKSENDYLTLSTGRCNSQYMNYSFKMGATSRIPTLTLTYLECDLLNAVNTATVENITDVLDDMAGAGVFSETESGATLYSGLTLSGKREIGANLLSLRPENGFESISDLKTAWDSSMTLEEITTEISPNNFAVVHTIVNSGSYGYGSFHDNSLGKDTSENLKKTYINKWEVKDFSKKSYANIYSKAVITEFKLPMKKSLSDFSVNYTLSAIQNNNKGGFDVYFDTAQMMLSTVPAVYDGKTDSDTLTQFTEWTDYAKGSGWQAGPQNLQSNYTGYETIFTQEANLTSYALSGFKASSSDYFAVRAGGASIYDGWRITKIPTMKLSYTASSVLDHINAQTDAGKLIDDLGVSGLLNASESGYNGYKGLDISGKTVVSSAISEKLQNGGFESYADFIEGYDEAVEAYVNSVISAPSVRIDFDNKTVENTGTNEAVIPQFKGNAQYVSGADGSNALYITNTFGKNAQNYLDLGEYKFGNSNFSIVFWMRAVEAGIGEFGHDADGNVRVSAVPVDFTANSYKLGGVVLSNKDFSVNGNKGFAFTAMPAGADFGVNTKIGDNEVMNKVAIGDAVESRWHQIAYTVDRNGNALTYVDNKVVADFNIAASSGNIDFDNAHLVFGADGFGQYGMISGEFDDIEIYPFALGENKLEEMYYEKMFNKVVYEAETLLNTEDMNKIYSEESKDTLSNEFDSAKAYLSAYTLGNKNTLIEKYNEFDDYYNDFLNKDSNGVALFTSDIHISGRSTADGHGRLLVKSLNDHEKLGLNLKTWITAGDYSETGNNHQHFFFDILDANIPANINAVVTRGNHDEPANGERTDENGNKISLSREELREEYQDRMDKYLDKDDEINKKLLGEDGTLDEPYYYLNDGIAHYIVIDNYDGGTTRWISPEQFEWLEQTLNEISGDGKAIFVIQHLPITGSVGSSTGGYYLYEEYGEKLVNLLNSYENDNIFLLNGHTHNGFGGACNSFADMGNFWQINSTSLGKGASEGYTAVGVAQYINVYDDRVVFRARNFDTDEWLRDYDKTFMLKEVSGDIPSGDIPSGDTPSGDIPSPEVTETSVTVSENKVSIQNKPEAYTLIIASYIGNKLIDVKPVTDVGEDNEITFAEAGLITENATEIKAMLWNSLEFMMPLCK